MLCKISTRGLPYGKAISCEEHAPQKAVQKRSFMLLIPGAMQPIVAIFSEPLLRL